MAKTGETSNRIRAEDAEESHSRMSFGEHLEELRKRIIRAAVGSILGIALCLYYVNGIILIITHPYRAVMQGQGYEAIFSVSKPTEVLINYMTVGIQAGLVISSPWIIFQVWSFVAAGLYKKERRVVYRYVGPSALLFLLGVAFFYFIVLPLTLSFFVRFTEDTAGGPVTPTVFERWILPSPSHPFDMSKIPEGKDLDPSKFPTIPLVKSDPPPPAEGVGIWIYNVTEGKVKLITKERSVALMVTQQGSLFANFPRLSDYLSFVMFTALVFGLAFELPMVIMILAQIDIVRTQTFRDIRKYAYFGLAVLSAIAAPSTDLLTMFCLMIPMIFLYEIGILAAAFVTRGRKDDDD